MTESENSTKSGRFTELLGSYDPRKTTEVLKTDRVKYWLSMGAGVTGTVNNLLIKKGIIRGKKTHVGMDNVVKEKPVEEAPAPVAEEATPAAPEAVAEAPVAEPVVEETTVEPAPVEEVVAETPAEEASQPSSETPAPESAPVVE